MSVVDPFTHIEEAWKLEANPFPPEGIRRPGSEEPFSPLVFPEETADFNRKLIRGAILARRGVGFLWSQGPGGTGDTGFGKTTLMLAAERAINEDFGATVLQQAGMKTDRLVPVAAAYANLTNLNASGLYPVLFAAVVNAAAGLPGETPLLDKACERIVAAIGNETPRDIEATVRDAHLRIAPGGVPLRSELVSAFAGGGARSVHQQLAQVSPTARLRNGLQYLDFLVAVLAAAGIDHLFLFVDQLEDLAVNKSVTSQKRSREIGRIRDMLEDEPYASRVHHVFTFHNSAAMVLQRYWEQNRLPRFEIAADNTASVVVLRGLSRDDQVAELLKVYLEERRLEPVEDELLPFTPDTLGVLRQVSQGRVGILLRQAHQLLEAAALRGRGQIDGQFAEQYFQGAIPDVDAVDGAEPDAVETTDLDELLLG